jgi:hypothetical protein
VLLLIIDSVRHVVSTRLEFRLSLDEQMKVKFGMYEWCIKWLFGDFLGIGNGVKRRDV